MKIQDIIMQAYKDDLQSRKAQADHNARRIFVIIPVIILIVQFILLQFLGV
jgi:hypothetical protein